MLYWIAYGGDKKIVKVLFMAFKKMLEHTFNSMVVMCFWYYYPFATNLGCLLKCIWLSKVKLL